MARFSIAQLRLRLLVLALVAVAWLLAGPASLAGAPDAAPTSPSVPVIEFEQDDLGLWERWSAYIIEFQRRANAEVAEHMNAINSGEDLGAFFLGLGIAFIYGIFHAFGPGHGKFIIVSYFLGREVQIGRGVLMAVQVAIVHVIAAIVIVWLADVVLKAGFGMGLAEVPGVRAGSFLIIAGIGVYMLYQATRAALGYIDPSEVGHGHSHAQAGGHGHSHAQTHSHGHDHASGEQEASKVESGLMAFAAGVVPCPGAVLIMLYAVANDMIYPGFILVAAMSVGIGLTICLLGISAIVARKTAMRMIESAGGGASGVAIARHVMNFGGATIVTVIGIVSFIAFLDVPIG